jgi:hypothetical protein
VIAVDFDQIDLGIEAFLCNGQSRGTLYEAFAVKAVQ